MKIRIFPILGILISACSVLSVQGSPTIEATNTTISSSLTSQPSAIPSLIPTNVTIVQRSSLCPSERMTTLDNLGLSPRLILVLLPLDAEIGGDTQIPYLLMGSVSSEPASITSVTPPQGWVNRAYTISPDGHWVSYIRWEKSNMQNRKLLVSSLGGEKQFSVMEFTDIFRYSRWLSNNKLVIMGVPDIGDTKPSWYEYAPIEIIDPFTLAEQPLESLPDEDILRDQLFIFSDSQSLYDLYSFGHSPFEKFVLYVYANKVSQPVFQWLTNSDGVNSINTRLFYQDNAFSIVVTQPYGLDISSDLSLEAIKLQMDYAQAMERLELPKELLPLTVQAWAPKTNSLLLSEVNSDIDNPRPLKFYNLDYKQKVIKDYCFEIPTNLDGIYPSPDGHFISFSFRDSGPLKGGITVLNLDTGFMSVLENYHMIGWGQN